jgi:hypothetical protein
VALAAAAVGGKCGRTAYPDRRPIHKLGGWAGAKRRERANRRPRASCGPAGAGCGAGETPPPPSPPSAFCPRLPPSLALLTPQRTARRGGLSPQKLGDFCSVYPSSPSPLALTTTLLTAPAVGVQVSNANTCATKGCTAAATCLGADNICYTFSKNDCVARGFCWCGECPPGERTDVLVTQGNSGYCPLPMR